MAYLALSISVYCRHGALWVYRLGAKMASVARKPALAGEWHVETLGEGKGREGWYQILGSSLGYL